MEYRLVSPASPHEASREQSTYERHCDQYQNALQLPCVLPDRKGYAAQPEA